MRPGWELKGVGCNGSWWILHAGDAVYASVSAEPGPHRHHLQIWWRVKVGPNIIFEGDEPDVKAAEKAAEDKLRSWAKSIVKALPKP